MDMMKQAKFVDTISSILAVGVGVDGLFESAGKYAGKLGSIRHIFKNIFKFKYKNEQAEIRERVLKNIQESRIAREASNYRNQWPQIRIFQHIMLIK